MEAPPLPVKVTARRFLLSPSAALPYAACLAHTHFKADAVMGEYVVARSVAIGGKARCRSDDAVHERRACGCQKLCTPCDVLSLKEQATESVASLDAARLTPRALL